MASRQTKRPPQQAQAEKETYVGLYLRRGLLACLGRWLKEKDEQVRTMTYRLRFGDHRIVETIYQAIQLKKQRLEELPDANSAKEFADRAKDFSYGLMMIDDYVKTPVEKARKDVAPFLIFLDGIGKSPSYLIEFRDAVTGKPVITYSISGL